MALIRLYLSITDMMLTHLFIRSSKEWTTLGFTLYSVVTQTLKASDQYRTAGLVRIARGLGHLPSFLLPGFDYFLLAPDTCGYRRYISE